MGRIPFAGDGLGTLRVRVFVDGNEFTAMLDVPGAPTRVFRSGTCEDVIMTAASAAATHLDELVVEPPHPAMSAPDGEIPDDRSLMLEIEQLEDELIGVDTAGPTSMLVSGTAAMVLGAGGIAAATTIRFLDPWCSRGDACDGDIAIAAAVSGAVLIGGIVLVTIGGSNLPAANTRRRQLQRRIDDRRRLLDARADVSFGFGSASLRIEF